MQHKTQYMVTLHNDRMIHMYKCVAYKTKAAVSYQEWRLKWDTVLGVAWLQFKTKN